MLLTWRKFGFLEILANFNFIRIGYYLFVVKKQFYCTFAVLIVILTQFG